MPRLLVVAPNWIGDALMAQPLLARLHEKIRGLELDVLAPPWVAPVMQRMPQVREVIAADLRHGRLQLRSRWKLGRELKARRYDQAIVLPNSWKSALVPFFADIALRSGYIGESRYGLLNLIYRKSGIKPASSAPLYYARLAEAPGREPREPLPPPSLRICTEEIESAKNKFGLAGRYAVFCPGAEYGPAKRWPYFAQLSEELAIQKVLLGSPNDAEAAAGVRGLDLVGRTSLDEAIALIAGAELVVSNDSGLMHVAAALGRPQVALFGSSSPERTPPLSAASRVLWLRVECSPCFERVCPLGHFRCMREMTVAMVRREIDNLTA
ncbi:MAG TPA: lipopolysaccharide heptosyltransferase II [Burkholderiales bacterium]|nr:lipopolysaccharide heptosyltransferase II [Burkholderiales bacterium]